MSSSYEDGPIGPISVPAATGHDDDTVHAMPSSAPQAQRDAEAHVAAQSRIWPWYLLVCLAVLAMSWGGPLFALIVDTPALLRAAWRLTATTVMMLPGMWYDWTHADAALRKRLRGMLPVLVATGAVLAIHFCLFAYSIDHTSFVHAMLVVSVTPMLLVAWALLLLLFFVVLQRVFVHEWRRADAPSDVESLAQAVQQTKIDVTTLDGALASSDGIDASLPAPAATTSRASTHTHTHWTRAALRVLTGSDDPPHPPTSLELIGSVIAFGGVAALALVREAAAVSSNRMIRPYSLEGDVAAFFAAVTVGAYLIVGGRLRKWMPLWLYATSVTGAAAIFATIGALALEPVSLFGTGPLSVFGWLFSGYAFGITVAIAFVPGILGHTLVNLSLQRVNPLVVSVVQLSQPGISGVIGWGVGVQGAPATPELIAAPLILVGIMLVVTGSRQSPLWKTCKRP